MLNSNLEDKVDILCFAKIKYEHEGYKKECLEYCYDSFFPEDTEKDWLKLGFQNKSDPSTDFRGLGTLGLLHMLSFIENNFSVAKEVLARSQKSVVHQYPFF
jgi:hypothetical protein